jgi:hypothetical protein
MTLYHKARLTCWPIWSWRWPPHDVCTNLPALSWPAPSAPPSSCPPPGLFVPNGPFAPHAICESFPVPL